MSIAKINKRISFHCARHTFASLHVQANTHMHDLKSLLGHGSVQITEIYTHSINEKLVESMGKLGELLTE
ncbi:MAG: tyrosine-type recombinase/integrase [Flavobacteriales bacterium]|nr:tyrosine-type recombinase/integrase [Flavobacteriales bacterium]MBL4755978.1 tyrosine-type recombinase/integrase [Flavobacteriales bacterium]